MIKSIQLFLKSSVSGYLFVLVLILMAGAGVFVTKQVADYKQLQVDAAFCQGQLESFDVLESLQNRVIDNVNNDAIDVIEDVQQIKKDSYDETLEGPTGCAAERAPDAILRYHGWLRDTD